MGVEEEGAANKADLDEDYRETFIAKMKKSGTVRFGVIDYNNKMLFVHYVPDKGKDKMVYASIKEALVQSLVGLHPQKLQANDDQEMSAARIAELTKSNV